jgi:septum site-determining protein MinC
MSLKKTPFFELRSGSVDTLLFVVKTTDLDALKNELTRRFDTTPEFFANDLVALDVRRLDDAEQLPLAALADLLSHFRMRALGVIANPAQHEWVAATGLPLLEARDRRAGKDEPQERAESIAAAASAAPSVPEAVEAVEAAIARAARGDAPAATGAGHTTVIDRPLRSGQQIYAKGDLVVLGLVSYGAEVIAEGNIHIYAPLRGRALAGVHGNHGARIFCTCLEPELISIAGIYRTTETPLAPDVLGHAVQIRLDQEKLIIEPLRLK